MSESIANIKSLYRNKTIDELPLFIAEFEADERAGVKQIVNSAKNKLLALEKEKKRVKIMREYDNKVCPSGYLCGIDEVGRGPLAGPVCAGAVILPRDEEILYLNDSKQLSEKKREELYDIIMDKAISVSVCFRSPERIDEINILEADYEAMEEAVSKLTVKPDILLLDAVHVPQLESYEQVSVIKGDTLSASIAAASIVAKVVRDRYMVEMDAKYPEYGFASNKGYGSAQHIAALKKYGPCEIHRRSFIGNFIK